MNLRETFRVALLAIRRNKVRSALTMLGVIIGVASVIAMIALGSGARAAIDEQIQSQGTTLIFVSSGSFGGPGRAAQGAGIDADADARGRRGDRARDPVGRALDARRRRPRAGDRRQRQLEHPGPGRQRGLPGDPQLGDRRRSQLHAARRAGGRQGVPAGRHRGANAVPRRRPGRPDHPRARTCRSACWACSRPRARASSARTRTTSCSRPGPPSRRSCSGSPGSSRSSITAAHQRARRADGDRRSPA